MAARDPTDVTDVTKFKLEADGSFKRSVTIFRDSINVGGKFEPAPGPLMHVLSDEGVY
jgi:putative glutathione S-transferase